MTTVIEHPMSVAGLYQYHDVIGLLSAGGPGFSGPVSVALGPDGAVARSQPGKPKPTGSGASNPVPYRRRLRR